MIHPICHFFMTLERYHPEVANPEQHQRRLDAYCIAAAAGQIWCYTLRQCNGSSSPHTECGTCLGFEASVCSAQTALHVNGGRRCVEQARKAHGGSPELSTPSLKIDNALPVLGQGKQFREILTQHGHTLDAFKAAPGLEVRLATGHKAGLALGCSGAPSLRAAPPWVAARVGPRCQEGMSPFDWFTRSCRPWKCTPL